MSGAKFNPTQKRAVPIRQAVNETNQKLTAEVSDDVVVDLREDRGHFIFQGRIPERKIFPPAPLDRRTFLQKEKQIDRHHDEAQQKTGHTEKPADALLEQRPDFLAEIRQLPLQVWHLLLDPFLDALAICRGERRGSGRDRFSGRWRNGRVCRHHSGRSRGRWRNRRRRFRRPGGRRGCEQPVYKTRSGRGSFFPFRTRIPKGVVITKDEIHQMIARFQRVLRQLAPNAGRLHGNDGGKPCDQNANGENCDREKRQNRLRPPQSTGGHFCDQRIEEIGEDDSDRYWDQDRLNESDHVGRDPDDRASYRNEHHDEERRERSPHRLALPGCGIFCHSMKRNPSPARRRAGRPAFQVSRSD